MGRLLDEDTVIKVLERWQKAFRENSHYVSASDLSLVVKDVRELPPAQPVATDTNVGNNSEFPNNSDTVSRQAAIDAVNTIGHIATMPDGDKCIRRSAVKYTLSMLPPAQPERAEGEWVLKDYLWECNKCGCRINVKNPLCDNNWNYYFCPHCGTKMTIAVQRF